MRQESDWTFIKWSAVAIAVAALLGWLVAEASAGEPTRGITALLVTDGGEPSEVMVYADAEDPAAYHLRAFKTCRHVAGQIKNLPHVEGVNAWCVLDDTLPVWWLHDTVSWQFMTEDLITEIEDMKGQDQ